MLGMEMMIANMFGVKPEEMKNIVQRVVSSIENAATDMREIKQRLASIEERMNDENEDNVVNKNIPLLDNGGGGGSDNQRRSKRGKSNGGNSAVEL